MTAPALDAVRLSIHVLAACLWVGGQFTVAGLVPALRSVGADAPKAAAQGLAIWGAVSGVTALGALVLGVVLAG